MFTENIKVHKEHSLKQFISVLSEKLGDNNIILNESGIEHHTANVTGFKKEVAAVVYPSSVKDIQFIINCATEHKIALYPISQGKNWGMGSKLPVGDNNVILDLSAMNRIIEINTEFGYAVIEPGVTQKQLADHLETHNLPYFIDVTGSGCETSIVGNMLDRGVAYNSMRVDSCLSMDIVMGTGELLTTGFGHYENAVAKNLYKYGIGPDLMGLFFQSNFGIVTQVTVKLQPIMPCRKMFLLSIANEQDLASFFKTIKQLRSYNLFNSIIHVANRERSKISVTPLVSNFCKENNLHISDAELKLIVDTQLKGSWSAIGSLMGTHKQVKATQYELTKHLSSCGKVTFFNVKKVGSILRLLKLFYCKKQYIFLSAIKPLLGLTLGKPTNAALHSVVWPNKEALPNTHNPDHSASGIIFCLPILPLHFAQIDSALRLINQVTAEFRFKPAITLNILNELAIETVVSISFKRADLAETESAHRCIKQLNTELKRGGYYPYRIDINNMKYLFQATSHWEIVYKLKALFDPHHIIAPGRYVPTNNVSANARTISVSNE